MQGTITPIMAGKDETITPTLPGKDESNLEFVTYPSTSLKLSETD